jgi:hypothetical protein
MAAAMVVVVVVGPLGSGGRVRGVWCFEDVAHRAMVRELGAEPSGSGEKRTVLHKAVQDEQWGDMFALVRDADAEDIGQVVPSGQTMAGSTAMHLAAFKRLKGAPWWGDQVLKDMTWKALECKNKNILIAWARFRIGGWQTYIM